MKPPRSLFLLTASAALGRITVLGAIAPRDRAIPAPPYGIEVSPQLFCTDGDPLLVANFSSVP